MKETLKSLKDYLGKLSKKTKITAAIVAAVVIVGAIVITMILNHKDYVVLFSGVTDEETTEILGKLQEMGVEYSYGDGSIRVPSDVADTTRAQLAYDGYPKSGFTYDVFTANAGGMTTDMEKQTYKLYELQNRIGATVRLFDGVKDAKVTIAMGDEQRYVLEDSGDGANSPSASVVVMMEDGGSPSAKQAAGIQRLVARSVPSMSMENVSVLDGSGIEVSGSAGGDTSGDAAEDIAQLIETQITKKVVHVLEPFYGAQNIRVAARGTVNMEKIIRETTTYSTPEKIDENDKTGIVSGESNSTEASGSGIAAAGVPGTESNADVSQYAANADEEGSGYLSESETRDYLVNQIKEQGEIDPGMLQDLTVSVSINGTSLGELSTAKLLELIGNATGIAADVREEKIAIANAPFYKEEEKDNTTAAAAAALKDYMPYIVIAAAVLLVLFILLFVIFRIIGKKKRRQEEAFFEEAEESPVVVRERQPEKPEILNLQNERSRELRETVREFADENPEISAQMIRNWLHGGEDVGRNTRG